MLRSGKALLEQTKLEGQWSESNNALLKFLASTPKVDMEFPKSTNA